MSQGAPSLRRWTGRLARWTPALVYIHDLVAAVLSLLVVLVVRYHFERKPLPEHLLPRSLLAFLLLCAVIFPLFRLQRGMWRFTALNDIVRLALASGAVSLLLIPVLFTVDRLSDFPRSTPLILTPVLLGALALGRVAVQQRRHGDLAGLFRIEDRDAPAAVVVGPAEAIAAYLTGLRRRGGRSLRVAGLIVLGDAAPGRTIIGAEVLGGVDQLAAALLNVCEKSGRPPTVLIAEPRPSRALLDKVVAAAAAAGARVSRVRGDPRPGRPRPRLGRRPFGAPAPQPR